MYRSFSRVEQEKMSDAVTAPQPPVVQEVGPPARQGGWLAQMFGCTRPRVAAAAPKASVRMVREISAEAKDAANRFGI